MLPPSSRLWIRLWSELLRPACSSQRTLRQHSRSAAHSRLACCPGSRGDLLLFILGKPCFSGLVSWQPAVCSLVGELLFSRSCDFLTHPWQQFKIIFGGLFVFNNNNSIKSPALFLCKKKKKMWFLFLSHICPQKAEREQFQVWAAARKCSRNSDLVLKYQVPILGHHLPTSAQPVGWDGRGSFH